MSAEDGRAFVDANVLVYALDGESSLRGDEAKRLLSDLLDEGGLRTSTQVLQELFVVLTRKVRKPCSPARALSCLDELAVWPLFVIDNDAIRQAAHLSGEASFSFWDALIVVSAARSGAAILNTDDLNHSQEFLGVKIVNPFHKVSDVPGDFPPPRRCGNSRQRA